jgi:rhodanese-related sulfurtransferase
MGQHYLALGGTARSALGPRLWAGVCFLAVACCALAGDPAPPPDSAFPLRARYLDVPVLLTAELDRRFGAVVIVDVRSPYEYNTLRIKDALLIPVTDNSFGEQVRKLRAQTAKPIVFYCNGKTCHKSYDAVLKARSARVSDTYSYDAGIADWAGAHPEKTVLLGRSPIKAEDLISHDKFKAHLLEPPGFEAKIGSSAIVLDVRDRAQRDTPLFPFHEQRAALAETDRIDTILEQAKREHKTLLVYDAVGKQVEWFQYYLESKGVNEYYFMKGGAQGYFDEKYGKVTLGGKKELGGKKNK